MIGRVRIMVGAIALAWAAGIAAPGEPATPPPAVVETGSPAAQGSVAPQLDRGRDGVVWLTWLEPSGDAGYEFRCSPRDEDGSGWCGSVLIAPISSAGRETPPPTAFAASDRKSLAAAWVGGGPGGGGPSRVLACTSTDGGAHWSGPETLSRDGRIGLEPALTALADGRFLAAWLEAAPGPGPQGRADLHARVLGPGAPGPDQRVDHSVNAGSGPSLVPFMDGGAGIAYRSVGEHGVRDIRMSRLRHAAWDPGHIVNDDLWVPETPPAGGPTLAADGGRVFASWFTGADNDPRIVASSSGDAGTSFLIPLTITASPISGGPAAVLLHDGAGFVFWTSQSPDPHVSGLWMRRVTPDDSLNPALLVWPARSGAIPAAAIARDYGGGQGPALVVVAFASNTGKYAFVRTLELTIQEAGLLAADNDACHCAPTPEELVGYPIRGTVRRVDPLSGLVTFDHEELPGILDQGSDFFRAAPELAAILKPGSACLARIERRDGAWRIFDVRLLVNRSQ